MIVLKPPTDLNPLCELIKPWLSMPVLFLAGSIEMGAAVDWQSQAEQFFTDKTGIIFNPRRNDWDSSWEQSVDNLQFVEQVRWEQTGLRLANKILFYFAPNTKSPITLQEHGQASYMNKGSNVVVCCPNGFWRRGNVELISKDSGMLFAEDLIEAFELLDI